ncbi:MAG: hypothetical protein QOH83_969 [Solirubrobacteraceae bacterium]|nr:hypothetical protein [Solirubrobacteraceae bacterium]
MARVMLDLHGARAQQGVEIDALETFLAHFRAALRDFFRASHGGIPRSGGRPAARDAAATAFRLVEFHTGSGIATLEPVRSADLTGGDSTLDLGEALSITTLRNLLIAIDSGKRLPAPVVEALGSARRAIGDDGSFGVEVSGWGRSLRVVIDQERMKRLQRPENESEDTTMSVSGRLHMIEADQPNRRVGIRGQDGVDWTCTYPDEMHPVVTTLIERLVRVEGIGRRITAATGRLAITRLDPILEHTQDVLFTVETVALEQLLSEQQIDRPQGLSALIDEEWKDDEESRLFLEATLGFTRTE